MPSDDEAELERKAMIELGLIDPEPEEDFGDLAGQLDVLMKDVRLSAQPTTLPEGADLYMPSNVVEGVLDDEGEPPIPMDPQSRAERLVNDVLSHSLTDDQALRAAHVLSTLALIDALRER